jgi:hypothetical protein
MPVTDFRYGLFFASGLFFRADKTRCFIRVSGSLVSGDLWIGAQGTCAKHLAVSIVGREDLVWSLSILHLFIYQWCDRIDARRSAGSTFYPRAFLPCRQSSLRR